jgi:hypothetical protein
MESHRSIDRLIGLDLFYFILLYHQSFCRGARLDMPRPFHPLSFFPPSFSLTEISEIPSMLPATAKLLLALPSLGQGREPFSLSFFPFFLSKKEKKSED